MLAAGPRAQMGKHERPEYAESLQSSRHRTQRWHLMQADRHVLLAHQWVLDVASVPDKKKERKRPCELYRQLNCFSELD